MDPKANCHAQWLLGGKPVQDAANAYVPTPADAGMELSVEARFDCVGSHTVTRRAAPAIVLPGTIEIPRVRLTGGRTPGLSLKATAEDVKPANVKMAYQWERGGVSIEGARDSTYLIQDGDRGLPLRAVVLATAVGFVPVAVTSSEVEILDKPRNIVEKKAEGVTRESGVIPGKTLGPYTQYPAAGMLGIITYALAIYWWIYSMSAVRGNLWWLIGCVLVGVAAVFLLGVTYGCLEVINPFARLPIKWRTIMVASVAGLASGVLAVVFGGMPQGVSWLDSSRFLPWTDITHLGTLLAWVFFVIFLCALLYSFILIWVAIFRTAKRRKRERRVDQ